MERCCEPELMDDALQVQAYAEADFSAGDQAVVERIAELFPAGPGRRVVDLGCGPGNISLRLVERFAEASVLGLDGAAAMLAVAEQRLHQWRQGPGVAQPDRLAFRRALLPLAPGDARELAGGFTAVVSNSLLHHLHDPLVLWRAVAKLAAPGATVYVKDLRRPSSPEAAQDLLARHLADAPPVLQRDYLASLHAAFEPGEVADQLQITGLGQLQVRPLDDRYLEVWGRLS
ncbi:class I SAM-dependent methyltransferase [Vulcanococcus limneticus]|uniref:class I SAM-dependent methyltransferase n=1 Tax=Vulcanococcus limneticus TaxID=2170428 RepID=UPI00398C0B3C